MVVWKFGTFVFFPIFVFSLVKLVELGIHLESVKQD